MIKQTNQTFALIPFTATYNGIEVLVDSKEVFESQLVEQAIMRAEMDALAQGEDFDRAGFVPNLPTITYVENILTEEQQNRLTEISNYGSITLDEVNSYVIYGTEPMSNTMYAVNKLKADNERLQAQNVQTLMALAEMYESLMPTE